MTVTELVSTKRADLQPAVKTSTKFHENPKNSLP